MSHLASDAKCPIFSLDSLDDAAADSRKARNLANGELALAQAGDAEVAFGFGKALNGMQGFEAEFVDGGFQGDLRDNRAARIARFDQLDV